MFRKTWIAFAAALAMVSVAVAPAKADVAEDIAEAIGKAIADNSEAGQDIQALRDAIAAILTGAAEGEELAAAQAALAVAQYASPAVQAAIGAALATQIRTIFETGLAAGEGANVDSFRAADLIQESVLGSALPALQAGFESPTLVTIDTGTGSGGNNNNQEDPPVLLTPFFDAEGSTGNGPNGTSSDSTSPG